MKYSRVTYDCGNGSGEHSVTIHLIHEDFGMTPKEYRRLHDIISIESVAHISVRGDEPFDEPDLVSLLRKLRKDFPGKDISVRTSYTINEICTSSMAQTLALVDSLNSVKNGITKVFTKKDFYCIRGL